MNLGYLMWIGVILVFIGVFIIVLSSVLMANQKTEGKTGAIIFLGPIPLTFGTDRNLLILVSVLMIVLMVAYSLFFR